MTEEELEEIVDLLPDRMDIWQDGDELAQGYFTGRDHRWWGDTLGHPRSHPGCCRTCGCATTCLYGLFHDSLIQSTLRELDRIGVLVKPSTIGPDELVSDAVEAWHEMPEALADD